MKERINSKTNQSIPKEDRETSIAKWKLDRESVYLTLVSKTVERVEGNGNI